ncbi:conditioned medium factor receptor 1-like [Ruditapes philippinarum]|uniref:conditioned medium factor receptor 1-like n=1 Tax=Ruditapes philippinarum TaxID=129788 RepID=UPI00295B240C|nr:conditioned medium factor receptor 1-like [Ruditapes philippinarum]
MLSFTSSVVIFLILIVIYFVFRREFVIKKKIADFEVKFPDDKNKTDDRSWYDVVIVGAGPAGSTAAFFLAKLGWKCLLLEKKKFPRDKYCGDAVCKTAIEILMEMGIYEQLICEKKAHISDSGGMCSPGGLSYIGRSKEGYGEVPAALACKRILLDEAIAMAAKRMGADLKEEQPVADAKFDSNTGLWTVSIEESDVTFTARVLVCADGAPSRLATKLGIVTQPPASTCSRSYVEGGTHKFKADGVVFYNKDLLPGYAALFRHPNDVLNYCCYIIPGNPKCVPDDIAYWHEHLMKEDPNISRALGNDYKIERMKAASLRLGGEKFSYDTHCIVVGDAAGMIDPLTGEGIHHAMEGGKLAAHFLDEVITHGNYDREVMSIFHDRWMERFGFDFKWSMLFCQLTYRFPILLDAATAAVQRKGDQMLLKWADIMTGRGPRHMLKPEFSFTITFELFLLLIKRLMGKPTKVQKTE